METGKIGGWVGVGEGGWRRGDGGKGVWEGGGGGEREEGEEGVGGGGGGWGEAGGIVLTPRSVEGKERWNSTTLNRSHYLAAKAHGCQAFQATPDWSDGRMWSLCLSSLRLRIWTM